MDVVIIRRQGELSCTNKEKRGLGNEEVKMQCIQHHVNDRSTILDTYVACV